MRVLDIEQADLVLALFDGSKGGTYNCVQYAEKKGKVVVNLWEEWRTLS